MSSDDGEQNGLSTPNGWFKKDWIKILSSGWLLSTAFFLYMIINSTIHGARQDLIFFIGSWVLIFGLHFLMKNESPKSNKRDEDALGIGLVLVLLAFIILVLGLS